MNFDPSGTGYQKERLFAFYEQVLERLTMIPGVRSASLSSLGPLSADDTTSFFNLAGFTPRSLDDSVVRVNAVSPQYFETLGIRVLAGRQFNDGDRRGSARVAILSESAVRLYFGGRSPIGATFRIGRDSNSPPIEIVGVVSDIRHKDLRDQPQRTVYLPLRQNPSGHVVAEVRAGGDVTSIMGSARDAVRSVTTDVPIESIKTARDQVDETLVQERLIATLSSLFGLLALLLAALGLYGVVNYAVTMRTGEIGIRMALGANRASVLVMIFREAGAVIAIGAALGVLAAIGATRVVANMLFGLTATDPMAYSLATATLVGIAGAAAFFPARRASLIDPVVALRQE